MYRHYDRRGAVHKRIGFKSRKTHAIWFVCLFVLCYQTTVLKTALTSSLIFSWDSLLCHIPDRHWRGGRNQDKIFLQISLGEGVGLFFFFFFADWRISSSFKDSSKLKPERCTQKEQKKFNIHEWRQPYIQGAKADICIQTFLWTMQTRARWKGNDVLKLGFLF